MKHKLPSLLLSVSLVASWGWAFAAEHPELKAFPAPQEGMERFVVVLPHKERTEEESFKVELMVGKEMLTDGVNQVRLANSIQATPLQGWGYTYYEVTGDSMTMSTLMSAPEGAPQVMTLVTAAPLFINYNSRLPIVVYAPAGFQIRYRIWSAAELISIGEPG